MLAQFAVVQTVGFGAACLLSAMHQQPRAWSTIRIATAVFLIQASTVGVVFTVSDGWRAGFRFWRDVYASAILFTVLAPSRRAMLDAALIVVGAGYAVLLIVDYVVVRQCSASALRTHEPYVAVMALLAGAWMYLRHRREVSRLARELLQDRCMMDQMWEEVRAVSSSEELKELCAVVAQTTSTLSAAHPQQQAGLELEGGSEVREPVHSLDQLYTQAKAVQQLLQDKVKTLSTRSEAYLCTRKAGHAPPLFERWAGVCVFPNPDQRIAWTELKPADRVSSHSFALTPSEQQF
eukprot:841543-Rhodomonas_salina.2